MNCTHQIQQVLSSGWDGDRLATIDMGRKLGSCTPCFLGEGRLGWIRI